MAFPGVAFFIVLAVIQFFIVADGLVSWFHVDWLVAANLSAMLSGLPLLIIFMLARERRLREDRIQRQSP
ncbi:hypothetical protein [Ferrovibrio terrae]|uniref:hypothetical protein n=1 Tax=Ferrovibrio terrae TaxID=2594003 RepID=UPI0031377E51